MTNSKRSRLLTGMINQFKAVHDGETPVEIVVEPVALVALGLKKSVAPTWNGVKVTCREITKEEVVHPGTGKSMGVMLDTAASQLVAADLVV